MTSIWMKRLGAVAAMAAISLVARAAVPQGWFLAGNQPTKYETGVDEKAVFNERPSAYLKSTAEPTQGFGTLMQSFSAEKYKGKRVRYSAYVQSQQVAEWAGLWMRIDGPMSGNQPAMLGFDNMQNRSIKGSTGWQRYEIVLDVPENAVNIALGILLSGTGSVWLNSNNVEVVTNSVPPTSSVGTTPDGPRNLSFGVK